MRSYLPWLIALSTSCGSVEQPVPDASEAADGGGTSDAAKGVDGSIVEDASTEDDASLEPDAAVGGDAGAETDLTYDELKALAEAYKAAHPGGDWDIIAKTPAQLASDPAAQQLLSVCGADQRPVFPILAWEYGGSDHQWIHPEASALVYCVYVPVSPSSTHWTYDSAANRVTADVYVLFPEQNPCNDLVGREQVAGCMGDPTNFEILVDTANLHDGMDVGLALAEASTELMLILTDGTKVSLAVNN